MEVTEVKVSDGKLVAERPVLQDSAMVDVGYVGEPGIIIGRLNAFDATERDGGSAEVVDVEVELSEWSTKAKMVQARRAARRGRQHRGRRDPGRRRPRAGRGRQLQARRGARRGARRRGRGDPRGGRRRLVPVRGPDRPDGQDRGAEALPGGRDLRRDPAQGRHAELREHPGDQQGPERADLRVLRPRAWSATSTRSCPS